MITKHSCNRLIRLQVQTFIEPRKGAPRCSTESPVPHPGLYSSPDSHFPEEIRIGNHRGTFVRSSSEEGSFLGILPRPRALPQRTFV
ncbi:hypothetical protein J6590_071405 [Homalodisca vitripennis]|nr:hypothetical protein J6590_071405 [Homalodisca vitripennis]